MSDGYGYYYDGGGSGYYGFGYYDYYYGGGGSGYYGGDGGSGYSSYYGYYQGADSGYYGGEGFTGSDDSTAHDLQQGPAAAVAPASKWSKTPQTASSRTGYIQAMSAGEIAVLKADSNVNATNGSRTEQGAWIYEDAAGNVTFAQMPNATVGTNGLLSNIDNNLSNAPSITGYSIVGEIHTHPFDSTYYDSSIGATVGGGAWNAPPSTPDVAHTPSNLIGIVVSGHNGTYYFSQH